MYSEPRESDDRFAAAASPADERGAERSPVPSTTHGGGSGASTSEVEEESTQEEETSPEESVPQGG